MSSHHEWADEVIAEHDKARPYAPENGQPLAFKPGDPVIYTNDQGARFRLTVTGLYKPATPSSLYARGYRYFLNDSAPWCPVRESSLTPDPERAA